MMFDREDFAPAPDPILEVDLQERAIQPAFDAYLYADSFSPAFRVEKLALNEEAARQGMFNVARNGDMHVDWLNPTNNRHHPVNLERRSKKGQAMCIGEGLRYNGDNNFQVLQAVAHRYLRKRKVFRFNRQAQLLANEIADTWVRERQNPLVIDSHKEADIVRQWEFDAEKRKYEQRRLGEGEFNTMIIRHHL